MATSLLLSACAAVGPDFKPSEVPAVILAIHAGLRDARAGRRPYFWAVLMDLDHRKDLLREGWKDVCKVFAVAVALDAIGRKLFDQASEIHARIADDTRLLTTSPSLDMVYRLKLIWRNFRLRLSVSARELTQHATSLESNSRVWIS